MTTHAIASRHTWLEARRDLLAAEKDLTRRTDRVAELRRKLPWVRVETPYIFDGPNGEVSLDGLFAGRSQLLVQHFMLGPGWKEGCKSCSYMADHADGMTAHLAARDVTFVAISRATFKEIESFRRRMGWRFNWVSSNANSFFRLRRSSVTDTPTLMIFSDERISRIAPKRSRCWTCKRYTALAVANCAREGR